MPARIQAGLQCLGARRMAKSAGLARLTKGLSEAAFRERFGTEEACRATLFEMRWREGLTCSACGHRVFCTLKTRQLFQCNRCKRQVRLTAGTVFQDSKRTWSERPGGCYQLVAETMLAPVAG